MCSLISRLLTIPVNCDTPIPNATCEKEPINGASLIIFSESNSFNNFILTCYTKTCMNQLNYCHANKNLFWTYCHCVRAVLWVCGFVCFWFCVNNVGLFHCKICVCACLRICVCGSWLSVWLTWLSSSPLCWGWKQMLLFRPLPFFSPLFTCPL